MGLSESILHAYAYPEWIFGDFLGTGCIRHDSESEDRVNEFVTEINLVVCHLVILVLQ